MLNKDINGKLPFTPGRLLSVELNNGAVLNSANRFDNFAHKGRGAVMRHQDSQSQCDMRGEG